MSSIHFLICFVYVYVSQCIYVHCVCVLACACVCMCVCTVMIDSRRWCYISGTEVRSNCICHVGAKNKTLVFCKSSRCSHWLNYLSENQKKTDFNVNGIIIFKLCKMGFLLSAYHIDWIYSTQHYWQTIVLFHCLLISWLNFPMVEI